MVGAVAAHWPSKLQWTTPGGPERRASRSTRSSQIDFSGGKIVYLSDLKPESVRWTPYFGVGKPPPAVRAVLRPAVRPRLRVAARCNWAASSYRKGLALHSRTEMVYRLPDRFSRFRAMAGIDDAVRPGGKVRLVIRGDDRAVRRRHHRQRPPRPIDLDLTGVRRLTIVVDFGDSLSVGDHLLLCNARLSK